MVCEFSNSRHNLFCFLTENRALFRRDVHALRYIFEAITLSINNKSFLENKNKGNITCDAGKREIEMWVQTHDDHCM